MAEVVIDYCPHPAQELFHQSRARFRVLRCGTRFGKDRCSINEMIKELIEMRDEERPTDLVPRVHAWIVAPTFSLAKQSWDELKAFTPQNLIRKTVEDEREMRWYGDVKIEVKSADRPEQLVSVGLDYMLMTEAARVKESAWRTLRGRLSSPGRAGKMIANSTPISSRGLFRNMFERGQDIRYPTWESWWFPTAANPYIPLTEIEEARGEMPERWFRTEYLAEWPDEQGAVFRGVRDPLVMCVTDEEMLEHPIPGHTYVMGVDWGRIQDFTVICVLDVSEHSRPRLVAYDRFNEIGWPIQVARVREIWQKFGCMRVVAEVTGIGDVLIQLLEDPENGIPGCLMPFKTSNLSKRNIIDALAASIEHRRIAYPEIPEMLVELELFEYKLLDSGNIRYSSPARESKVHDDFVMSLALAYFAAKGLSVPAIEIGPLLTMAAQNILAPKRDEGILNEVQYFEALARQTPFNGPMAGHSIEEWRRLSA